MSVTKEDGGKLNAFAREPRMEVIETGTGRSRSTTILLLAGLALVMVMVAVAAGIS